MVSSFSNHKESKKNILNMINESYSEIVSDPSSDVYVSKTDWMISFDDKRPWVREFLKEATDFISEMYHDLGYNRIYIDNIWFQQYNTGSQHGWHTHGKTNFSTVYYLDLPEDSSKTSFINPYNQKDTVDIDAKEGDFVTFPSFTIHKAPENKSLRVRTIIAFNVSVEYDFSEKRYN
jgi:hypothetical protein